MLKKKVTAVKQSRLFKGFSDYYIFPPEFKAQGRALSLQMLGQFREDHFLAQTKSNQACQIEATGFPACL